MGGNDHSFCNCVDTTRYIKKYEKQHENERNDDL
jgi:hypothetical protein